MFQLLLLALIAATVIHYRRGVERGANRLGELGLRYLLVGYCGFPMLIVSVLILVRPSETAAMLGVTGGGQMAGFFGWAYLGMSIAAILAVWFRGVFLVGPATIWGVYFAGATIVHLHDGSQGHGGVVAILVAHTLIAVLLFVGLAMSGLLRGPGPS